MPNRSILKLKQIFYKFEVQFDIKGQGQGHKFFQIVQDLKRINTQLKFVGKIPTVQKLLHSQGITQNV